MAPLSQGSGYGILVGVGGGVAFLLTVLIKVLNRYQKLAAMTMDRFMTGGRSAQKALMVAVSASSMTWTATLLLSISQAYAYGVSGAFFFGIGGTTVLVSFMVFAMELKIKAPTVNTFVELVKVRYGMFAHLVFVFFALLTNIFTLVELLGGGAMAFHYASGMNINAATFLMVVPVTVFTMVGGLKGSMIAEYLHVTIITISLLVVTMCIYTTNKEIGSPGRLWELCQEYTKRTPLPGNAQGSLMTMRSRPAGLWLVTFLPSIGSPVFLDQGHWNLAIAASPDAVLPGFLFGGILWFAMPFCCGTAIGLAGRALEKFPVWPTFPNPVPPSHVANGLILPYVSVAVLGKAGAGTALLMIYASTLSACTAEMVGASTVFTYDVYSTYINRRSTPRQQMIMTYCGVVIFMAGMCGFSLGLQYGKVTVGYLMSLQAVASASGILPYIIMLYWRGMNKYAAAWSPVLGVICGVCSFLGAGAGLHHDHLSLETTSDIWVMMAGTLVSFGSPLIFIAFFQLVYGSDHFDWTELRACGKLQTASTTNSESTGSTKNEVSNSIASSTKPEEVATTTGEVGATTKENTEGNTDPSEQNNNNKELSPTSSDPRSEISSRIQEYFDKEAKLRKKLVFARCAGVFVILSIAIIWPFTMYGTRYVFSKHFFIGWATVGLIWMFIYVVFITIAPIWEARETIFYTFRAIFWDLTGKGCKREEWQNLNENKWHKGFTSKELRESRVKAHLNSLLKQA